MRDLVIINRIRDAVKVERVGYSASYVSDIEFSSLISSAGFIVVSIPAGKTTKPHAHEHIQEVFVANSQVNIFIDGTQYLLESGDVVLVDPGEFHSFQAPLDSDSSIIAVKVPNIKDDKVSEV